MKKRRPTKPNPEAVAALAYRFVWYLAQREHKKRAARLKGQNRAALIKV